MTIKNTRNDYWYCNENKNIFRAVVFTKYDDIKEVFNMDDFAGRPSFAPAHRFRKGWETVENVEPEVNTNRPPGVLFSQVFI